MILDPNKLENPRLEDGKLIARCPACAEIGRDLDCRNLCIFDEGTGAYCCREDAEGKGGDHNKRIREIANIKPTCTASQFSRFLKKEIGKRPLPKPIPGFQELDSDDRSQIAKNWGWKSQLGLVHLRARGMVFYAEIYDDGDTRSAWVITDRSQINAQAVRIGGKRWSSDNSLVKTLPGYNPQWPIGAATIGDLPIVVMCHSPKDFSSVLAIADYEELPHYEIAPVCMAPNCPEIPDDALPFFEKKRVRIMVHSEEISRDAFSRWSSQLRRVGATVDGHGFGDMNRADGKPVKGPSDFLTLLKDGKLPASVFSDLFH